MYLKTSTRSRSHDQIVNSVEMFYDNFKNLCLKIYLIKKKTTKKLDE